MATNVKVSKFRQTKATLWKTDTHVLNIAPTGAIWDCANFLACNSKFIAVPWATVGATVVLPLDAKGKLASTPPMLGGHSGAVIDVAFHPFDDTLLYTASEDGTVKGWRLPEEGPIPAGLEAKTTLQGHAKKVGILTWHPSANNVLATASADNVIGLWDVAAERPHSYIKTFDEAVLSLNFNLDGSLINTTTKDKKVNIVDARSGAMVASAVAHAGSKTHRSVWAKRRGLIVTVGFNKQQFRQLMVWDIRNMSTPCHTEEIDQQSSVTMPFMDEDTNMLYLGGKGDGSIRYYELWDDATPITYLNSYQSTDPQKGLAMVPKRCMDVRACELARFVKIASTAKALQTISFHLPRKASEMEFQRDVYAPSFAWTPAMTAAEFFAGKNSAPLECDLQPLFDQPLLGAAIAASSPASPTPPNGGTESPFSISTPTSPKEPPPTPALSRAATETPVTAAGASGSDTNGGAPITPELPAAGAAGPVAVARPAPKPKGKQKPTKMYSSSGSSDTSDTSTSGSSDGEKKEAEDGATAPPPARRPGQKTPAPAPSPKMVPPSEEAPKAEGVATHGHATPAVAAAAAAADDVGDVAAAAPHSPTTSAVVVQEAIVRYLQEQLAAAEKKLATLRSLGSDKELL